MKQLGCALSMSSFATRPVPGERRRNSRKFCLFRLFCALALDLALDIGETAKAASSEFFASPEACAVSLIFDKRECANAFANAANELRRFAGEGSSKARCERRFQLCEPIGAAAEGAKRLYAPVLLGVEMTRSGGNWSVMPMVAVEISQGLRPQPISEVAAAPPAASTPPAWLTPVAAEFANQVKAANLARAKTDEARMKSERPERSRDAPKQ